MIYLFDVDGTLTPSRSVIDPDFQIWFQGFCKRNRVALVTGSDYTKTLEQLGTDILSLVECSFNCSGNAVYKKHRLIHCSDWRCPDEVLSFLEHVLAQSAYPEKLGQHFEHRTGMLNFSVVGRAAQGSQRRDYYVWDQTQGERELVAQAINTQWPEVQAAVGGETGIDIFKRGRDKSQILDHLRFEHMVFFGDRMDPQGNDHSLARAIIDNKRGRCYNVETWQDTQRVLQLTWPSV